MNQYCDTLIVGAGPAGLIAALMIKLLKPECDVTILEQGVSASRRKRDMASRDWVQGIGGAGLYSDGKLCMTLDVGGHLKELLSDHEKQQLLLLLENLFKTLGNHVLPEFKKHNEPLDNTRYIHTDQQKVQKIYPVWHIGTDHSITMIEEIIHQLEKLNIRILSEHTVLDINKDQEEFLLTVKSPSQPEYKVFKSHKVILAMGKVGAKQQAEFCEHLGVKTSTLPMYMGVRLEADSQNIQTLFSESKDPKFARIFEDGTKIKTHCGTQGGQVATLNYEGLPLAGGHSNHDIKTDRSGFALLWNGIQITQNPFDEAKALLKKTTDTAGNRLIAQLLNDFIERKPANNHLSTLKQLTNQNILPVNLWDFLPETLSERILMFIEDLARKAPGIKSPDTVLYAPAIEWWMKKVSVSDKTMETSCPGLYVCGDGAGWSQGIIHASATGVLAASSITRTAIHSHIIEDLL